MAGCACVVIVDMQFIQNQYQSLEEAYTEISNGREMDLNMMQQVFEAELHATAQYQGKAPPRCMPHWHSSVSTRSDTDRTWMKQGSTLPLPSCHPPLDAPQSMRFLASVSTAQS